MPIDVMEGLNTYEPCSKHKNGHFPHCKDCETDLVRDLLRRVANSESFDHAKEILGSSGGKYMMVYIPKDLWEIILPLRTPSTVKAE